MRILQIFGELVKKFIVKKRDLETSEKKKRTEIVGGERAKS